MRAFGIAVIVVGILACFLGIFAGFASANGDNPGLGAIAVSIAAVGIVAAAAIIFRNLN
jgi:hypothetical protein